VNRLFAFGESGASGAGYEPFMGRWSRLVAREFLAWLAVPPGSRWLDVGCGTGALSQTIAQIAEPSAITGVDPSPAYIAFAQESLADARASFLVGDGQSLPADTATYDLAVAGLALNFMPDPSLTVVEMMRVTRAGGLVAAYVWDYATGMQPLRYFWDAAVALDPTACQLDEGQRFPLCRPAALTTLFRTAPLAQVAVRVIEVATPFHDFDDYWSPFLGGQGPAPGYTAALSEEQRAALREQLRAILPARADGSIALTARAWAVRGRKM
jgi:SAM-dependent methyltransferase